MAEAWTAGSPRSLFGRFLGMGVLLRAGYWLSGSAVNHIAREKFVSPLEMWTRWDAPHYLDIAHFGYQRHGAGASWIAFLPVYPALVRIVSSFLPNYTGSALVVSLFASAGAATMLAGLTGFDLSASEAWRAGIFLYAFPTAYFLALPYSESVFLFFVLAALYAARTKRWVWAGVFGAFATASRMVGLAILPALAVEALWMYEKPRERFRRLAAIGVAGLGFLCYLVINLRIFGNAFHFLHAERVRWHQHFVPPWSPIVLAFRQLVHPTMRGTWYWFVYPANLIAVFVAGALLLTGRRRLRPADQVFGWTVLVLSMCESRLISLPRYLLTIYPLFIVLACIVRRQRTFAILVAGGVAIQMVLVARYAIGGWAF